MNPSEFFSGRNFMTPSVIEYGWVKPNKLAYELSTGKGITGKTLFGVTVNNKNEESDMNELYYSKEEAENYIRKLTKEFK